jgi:outer membrane protein OmpA-like peptidoglycan-associated protein
MKTIYAWCLLALFISPVALKAQSYLGVHSSNYSGMMGADLQPASIVDNRFVVDVNLFSMNTMVWQNAKYFDTQNMPFWWKKSFEEGNTGWMKPDSTFYARNFFNVDNPNNKSRGLMFSNQIDVLNFMFHVTPKIAIGFSAKNRLNVSLSNFSPQLMQLAESELEDSTLWNVNLEDNFLTLNAMAWNEYGINYAQVLYDKEAHFLKAGLRLKFLQGIAAAYMHTDAFRYNLYNSDTSSSMQGRFSYGYSENFDTYFGGGDNNQGNGMGLGDFFKSNSKLGVGFDIGVVYEWRPKWQDYKYEMDGKTNLWRKDEMKYKLRVGASVIDIGGMKFTKGGLSRDFTVDEPNLYDLDIFNGVSSLKEFDSVIVNRFDVDEDDPLTFYMNLPTAGSLQIDYHIWNNFYVNFTGIFSFTSKKNPHKVSVPTRFVLNPSYDHKWFGISVPLSYSSYQGFRVGLGARLGPITLGFADWNSILAAGKVRGTEFYFGLRVPVLYGRPKDRDGDKVSDKKDECKDVPGVWAFKGCPDTDGDGIQDTEDDCPTEPGLAQFRGCPDTDGDGIPDKDDDCPEEAGLAQFRGCPDTDGDGIPDKDDSCPTEPGLAEFNGCPDRDGDGIPDHRDACPDVAGPVELDGCPDTDGDGLLDFLDDCPTVPGPRENNGCPWPDTDGDGILDKDDKCPYIPGPVANQGCPYDDTDGDGVIDMEDECPNTPGPKENKGCPVIEKEAEEILKTAFDNLEFVTGNAIIKEPSKPSLDELAALLQKKPEWKLQISGHTDNVGNAQSNLVLSKKRAESVRDYLISKGVSADRLHVLFFGQTMPIDTNDTPEGRQRNRRVEMKIIFN